MSRQKPILSHLDTDGLSHLLGSAVEALRQRGEGALALRRLAEEHEELSLALAHGTPAGDSSTPRPLRPALMLVRNPSAA